MARQKQRGFGSSGRWELTVGSKLTPALQNFFVPLCSQGFVEFQDALAEVPAGAECE